MTSIDITGDIHSSTVKNVLPGDIVVYNNEVLLSINPAESGYLFKSLNRENPVILDKKEKIVIVRKLKIK
tara:strand:+ start:254 stop:463 length:210 start_codon:yes stop_codon:yes gene_type:complete